MYQTLTHTPSDICPQIFKNLSLYINKNVSIFTLGAVSAAAEFFPKFLMGLKIFSLPPQKKFEEIICNLAISYVTER